MYDFLHSFVKYITELFTLVLFARILMSWFNPRPNAIYYFLIDCTDPLLKMVRGLLPPLGFLDLSPLLAFFLIQLVSSFLLQILHLIFV